MEQKVIITDELAGERIDRALQQNFADHSRSYFQQLITDSCILLNDSPVKKSSMQVKAGDQITVTFPGPKIAGTIAAPGDLGVELLYEHEDFLVIFKPAGLLVHATHHKPLPVKKQKKKMAKQIANSAEYLALSSRIAKNEIKVTPAQTSEITLVDWLLHKFQELSVVGEIDRPGIVHRLDKDTSGILIIPRTPQSHAHISSQFQERMMEKRYLAVVQGHPPDKGSIDYPIGRHPHAKHKMHHRPAIGKEALTHYQVLDYFKDSALVEVHLVTGRTHQIRVHFATIGHPVVGDSVYGTAHPLIKRQALHAYQLSLNYKGKLYSIWRDMPEDMKSLIKQL